MPSLTPQERERMLGDWEICHDCGSRVWKNYCRECDEFYYVGHPADCPQMDPSKAYTQNHTGHRTY